MFAHVLALCFLLRLLKRSNHYVPGRILFKRQADKRARSISCFLVLCLELQQKRKKKRKNKSSLLEIAFFLH